jgi:hypothetical protein
VTDTTLYSDIPDDEQLPPEMPDESPEHDDMPDDDPDDEQMPDEEPPGAVVEAPVREADEILDPEALIKPDAIVARVQGDFVRDTARSVVLAERALKITRITTDEEEAAIDALRDELKAHQSAIEGRINPFTDLANKLHKGLTGLRGSVLNRVPDAVKHCGNLLAARIRAKQEAEEARQRAEREKALAAERERLRLEAEAAEAERKRLAAEAATAVDDTAKQQLEAEAERARQEAEQIRLEAATATAPPVVAQTVTTPVGASTRDNWQALPEHAETWADMPVSDKIALILHVASRCEARDFSLVNLLDVNTKACNQTAKAQKSTMKIPGIRAVNPPVYSKRSRG